MIVKNGDTVVFAEDCPYCTKNQFLNIGPIQQGGIAIEGKWVDEARNIELVDMYEVVKESGFVKEFDNQEYFFIPANVPIKLKDIYMPDGVGILCLNERVEVQFRVEAFVLENPNEELEEVLVRIL